MCLPSLFYFVRVVCLDFYECARVFMLELSRCLGFRRLRSGSKCNLSNIGCGSGGGKTDTRGGGGWGGGTRSSTQTTVGWAGGLGQAHRQRWARRGEQGKDTRNRGEGGRTSWRGKSTGGREGRARRRSSKKYRVAGEGIMGTVTQKHGGNATVQCNEQEKHTTYTGY